MHWLRDWLVYLLVRFFVCLVQAVRLETCDAIARWLAVLACDVIGIRRRTVDENIHPCSGPSVSSREFAWLAAVHVMGHQNQGPQAAMAHSRSGMGLLSLSDSGSGKPER